MNNDVYTIITSRLKNVSRRYMLTGIAEAFWIACTAALILTTAFTILESFQYYSPHIKKILCVSTGVIFLLILFALIIMRILRHPGTDGIARMVERSYPDFQNRLISAVQLGRLNEQSLMGQSVRLIDALLKKVEEETKGINLSRAVSTERFTLWVRVTYIFVAAILVLSLLLPAILPGSFYRLIDYTHAYTKPGKVTIYVVSSDGAIIRGDNFYTKGFIAGGRNSPLNVVYRWDDSDVWSMKPVDVNEKSGNFTLTLEKPRASFLYYLEIASYRTSRTHVTVIERPVIERLSLSITYPSYTGMETTTRNDNDGNIRAIGGTEVVLTAEANKVVKSMTINWSDSTGTSCYLNGNNGTASFTVTRDIDYSIGLVDTLGITNSNPISYRITCLEDEYPAVVILSPASDVVLPRSYRFPIVYRARDDFGLTSVTLNYELPFDDKVHEISLNKGKLEKDILNEYEWNLSGMNLLPDDVITYHIAVLDNDTVRGPKKSVSETRTVKVPSIMDLLNDTIAEQNVGLEKLKEMSERTGRRDEQLEDIKRNIMSGEEMDWSEKNALEEAKKDFDAMQQELQDLSEAIKQSAEKLSDEDVAAIETLEKMNKISQMMNELADGVLKDALKRLTEATATVDPEKIKEALEKYEISSEEIKEKLDRFIELLEQVMALQRFEMAKNLLESIAFKQTDIAERFKQNPDNPELAREQESLSSEMDNLQKDLDDITDVLNEKFSVNTTALDSLLDSTDVAQNMKETSDSMAQKNNAESDKRLDKSNCMLSEMLKTMQEMSDSMKNSNTAEIRKRLFKASSELLALSRRQEQLIGDVDTTGHEELAKQEIEIIDGLRKAKKSLAEFGSISVEISSALEQLMNAAEITSKTAMDSFASGSPKAGEEEAKRTLSTLNTTVLFLSALMSNASGEGQGMPGDLMEQLQKLASGELSLQMQMNSGMSQEMLAQLAAEQQKLAEMLSELGKKIAGDQRLQEMLNKLVEDMDDTANMMRMNKDRELVERKQLDIYRRLLDARRSRREKDENEDRKSWTAKQNVSRGADELAGDLGEKQRELNERIKKAMEDDFDPEFKRLIQSYFESMLKDRSGVSGR
ncbi:MAG: hypothetical protein JXB48_19790 [Candidatus Latescibacteria bacterium]|nr:hypothetical protein [Candidatus Latescibacterota bacterium]